ncbi:MAG: homoserine O-succinyltransferase [Candidatus Sulfotelmatobacter sp.]
MPLIIEGGRVPPRWAERKSCRQVGSGESYGAGADSVRIAFLNNMPDAALEDTEIQFFELLDAVSGEIPVRLKLHSLIGVPRGERGEQHLDGFYFSTDDLLNSRFDAVIMTGTEPRQANLRNEPYWSALTSVLDWAESNTVSTILSCLAAHAGVLHSDGIDRHPLTDKQFGVFDFARAANHQLTAGYGERVRFPHSRWNEVRADALSASGYLVLTQSVQGGVDSFVKKKKRSLFIHFQGHPEYGAQTLLKEYRRDVKRFLRAERETYPSMPKDYFDATTTKLLTQFRDIALSDRREELMEGFPEADLVGDLKSTWRSSAMSIYRNWLQYVASKKAEAMAFPAMAVLHDLSPRKRSALR